MMRAFAQDVRFALRALRSNALFAVTVILTLGLGVGANTAVYTWVRSLVLDPLPTVHEAGRLVDMSSRSPSGDRWSVSYPDYLDLTREAKRLRGLVVTNFALLSLRDGAAQAEPAWAIQVSANYFDVLGLHPALGRLLRTGEDSVPGATPYAVLGYSYWRTRFNADSSVVGKVVSLNAHPFTIVGVAPPQFGGQMVAARADLWVPIAMDGEISGTTGRLTSRDWRSFAAFGRLADGATLAQAQEEMRVLGQRHAAAFPQSNENIGFQLERFGADGPSAWFGPTLFAVLGITALVLLVACANVANLFLARALSRRREMGVRLALGASRGQVVRQLLTECLILSVLAGGVGLLVAAWARDLPNALAPATPYPIDMPARMDVPVFVFALGVSLATVFVFGLVPALQASKPDLVTSLKSGAGAVGHGRGRLRNGLVIAQVALSVVALGAAGLFLRSLDAARTVSTGYAVSDHVLLVDTDLHLAGYDRTRGRAFQQQFAERAATLPGVESVTLAQQVPLGFGGHNSSGGEVEGYVPARGENMSLYNQRVAPKYFATLGTKLLAGRDFLPSDDSAAVPVAVVNEAFVRRYWPGPVQAAIGRRIRMGAWRTVVGVVETAKYWKLDESPVPFTFLPQSQSYSDNVTLEVRAAGDPMLLAQPLRRLVQELDPNVPFLAPRSFRDHMGAAVFIQKMGADLLGLFGTIALLLSTMGIYSLVTFAVSQRTRELGIRSALGAGRREILRLVVGEGMRLTEIGLGIGVVGAYGVGRLMQSLLFGVGAADVVTFAAITLLLGVVALAASFLPARRAAAVSPMTALRTD